MKIILLILISLTLNAQIVNYDIKPRWLTKKKYKNIKILDSMELRFEDKNDISFSEISALAYKKKNLYALSNKGYLFHFDMKIRKNKVRRLKLLDARELNKKNGTSRLKKKHRDAEGMALIGNELFISFERKPRVDVFSLNGVKLRNHKINDKLEDITYYQTKNKALEAIAYNKKYGVVVAPELPLIDAIDGIHEIYTKNRTYKFKAYAQLSAMEFRTKNKLITLEKSYSLLTQKRLIIIRELNLKKVKKGFVQSRVIAILNSDKGWRLDNFEGLAKYGKNKFMMISDNNRSYFQKTLLVLFEVLD